MNIPGMGMLRWVGRQVDSVRVPLTHGRLGFVGLMKRTFEDLGKDHVGAFAGALTYSIVFAILPFLTFLTSLLGLFNARGLVNTMLESIRPALPQQAYDLISGYARQLTAPGNDAAFGVSALVTLVVSLYGASGAFRAIMDAMNVMYEVEEGRPIWKRYLISMGLALSVVLLLVSAVVLLAAGPLIIGAIANAVGLGPLFTTTWSILRWPILISFVLLAFALVYYYGPDAEQSFKFLTPGSFIALLLWLLFSGLFSIYVRNASFGNWGAVASIIVLMLYIYWSSYILLLGAEMNQIIEDASPEGKDEGDKTSPQKQAQKATT